MTKDRVNGIHSDLLDLTLHDGKKVKLKLGGTVTPTPQIVRTMEGSSSITIPIYDPRRKFLRGSLGAEDWNAELDGLWFRYLGTSGTLPNLMLTLEDREVAKIREFVGPVKVLAHRGKPNEVTRAEFIKRLVEEANPALTFICPQLEEVLPIEKQKQADEAKEEAPSKRAKGIGRAKGLKVKGETPSPEQLELGTMALEIADSHGAEPAVMQMVIMALIDETDMGAVQRGNVLAALEPYTQVRDAAEEISGFVSGEPTWTGTSAMEEYAADPTEKLSVLVQRVQKSETEDGSNYAAFEAESRVWVEEYLGGSFPEAGTGTAASANGSAQKPPSFEVAKGETYWAVIQRLAKEVNWRAFVVGQRFFYFDEFELARSAVRVAIDGDSDIEEVEIDFNKNKPVTEFKFVVTAKAWKAPPGSVVTVEDYGPASVGFGDAPPKKGQKIGLSSARKAIGGEGRGRYLVASIEAPLVEASDARKIKVTLKKPTAPLPEKRAESASSTTGSSAVAGSGGGKAGQMLEAARAKVANGAPYKWGGGHTSFSESGDDCSGFVSYVLHAGDALSTPMATTGLASWGEVGPGEEVTVYVKTTGGSDEEHTMIEILGHFFMAGGGENPNSDGAPCEFQPSAAYMAEFNVKRHPAGL